MKGQSTRTQTSRTCHFRYGIVKCIFLRRVATRVGVDVPDTLAFFLSSTLVVLMLQIQQELSLIIPSITCQLAPLNKIFQSSRGALEEPTAKAGELRHCATSSMNIESATKKPCTGYMQRPLQVSSTSAHAMFAQRIPLELCGMVCMCNLLQSISVDQLCEQNACC